MKRPSINRSICLLPLLFVLWTTSLPAEESKNAFKDIHLGFSRLDITGGFRLRAQLQNDFNIKKYVQGRDGFGETRLRMEFDFKFIKNMHCFFQIQDAHASNLNFSVQDFYPPYSPYENPMDIRQAFFEFRNIANTPLRFKIGRQAMQYGDNRILGPGEWGNVGRYFWDKIKLQYISPSFNTDLFIAKQVLSDPYNFDIDHSDLTVYGLYSTLSLFNPVADMFYILKRNNNSKFNCSSLGARLDGNLSMLFYSGTFAYQFGDTGTKHIGAYGYNAKLGYLVPALWMFEFGVEYSHASGDDNPRDGIHKTFDGVLGAIDLYYGRMALFSWMNLKDFQINLDSKPTRRLVTTIQYHWFELANGKDAWYYGNGKPQRRDTTGVSGTFLGQEILITAKYVFNKHVNVYAGGCYFFPGEFITHTPGYKGTSSLGFFQTELKF